MTATDPQKIMGSIAARVNDGQLIDSPEVAELKTQVAELMAYADKLAAGLPEGMLPKDIELIKDANWKFAEEVAALKAELEEYRTFGTYENIVKEWGYTDLQNECYQEALEKIRDFGKGNPNYVFLQADFSSIIAIAKKALEEGGLHVSDISQE